MFVIGLTGNFGTGKTTVSQILAELGAFIINADELGHQLLQPDTHAHKEIVAALGKSILKPNGEVDRNKLAQLVFDDTTALARLNQITHPKIYEIVRHKIEKYRQAGAKVVVIEAALLIEAGWTSLVNQLWVTIAPEATIIRRLKSSKGLSEDPVLARLRNQMPQEEKAKQADAVIETDCPLDALKAKISELWHNIL